MKYRVDGDVHVLVLTEEQAKVVISALEIHHNYTVDRIGELEEDILGEDPDGLWLDQYLEIGCLIEEILQELEVEGYEFN